jgi:hypothetical protein
MAHGHEHSHGHEYEPDHEHNEEHDELQHCIEECLNCHAVCTMTAQYCLMQGGELASADHVGMLLDCAEICQTSANFMLRGSPYHAITCSACAVLCHACADACREFDDEELQQCAEMCASCAEHCEAMAAEDGEDEE